MLLNYCIHLLSYCIFIKLLLLFLLLLFLITFYYDYDYYDYYYYFKTIQLPLLGYICSFLDNIYLAHLLSLMGTLSFVFPFHLFSTREESAPHTEAIKWELSALSLVSIIIFNFINVFIFFLIIKKVPRLYCCVLNISLQIHFHFCPQSCVTHFEFLFWKGAA